MEGQRRILMADVMQEVSKCAIGVNPEKPESLEGFVDAFIEVMQMYYHDNGVDKSEASYARIKRALLSDTEALKNIIRAAERGQHDHVQRLTKRALSTAQNYEAAANTYLPSQLRGIRQDSTSILESRGKVALDVRTATAWNSSAEFDTRRAEVDGNTLRTSASSRSGKAKKGPPPDVTPMRRRAA